MRLADRLRAALATDLGEGPVVLVEEDVEGAPYRAPAAVLVAVTDRHEPGVILTQRNALLRRHPGQIAFPGGRLDPDDDGPIAAALREAEEEIALPRNAVEVIGTGDIYRTITGYEVTPVIGVVPPDLMLVPHEAEVADVFEVPLAFLLDHANHQRVAAEWQGQMRHYYEINWADRRIWGATAAMIVNLGQRLQWTK